MLLLFLPSGSPYFVYGAFLSTSTMIVVGIWLTSLRRLLKPKPLSLTIGFASALGLYLLFLAGSYLVRASSPLGIRVANESTIYSLISSHPIVLQIFILVFDALGFEIYFRGNLQNLFAKKFARNSVFVVFFPALLDALIHGISLNPLWSITTFIADSVWGIVYFYPADLSANIASHFIWDVAIFVVAPIK
jgi:membrane protease YdiL (CAAX protease family)